MDPLTAQDIESIVQQIADDQVREKIARDMSADFSYVLKDMARFRVSVFRERGGPTVAFRLIPLTVPTIEQLNLPSVIADIAEAERGLVLVTGTTGSGKSTTLAAMIDFLNQNRRKRIITIEDPIEFVHTSNKSLIAQREVGADARGFLP